MPCKEVSGENVNWRERILVHAWIFFGGGGGFQWIFRYNRGMVIVVAVGVEWKGVQDIVLEVLIYM